MINYTQLKTELNTDPMAYGYAPLIAIGNDQGLADMLNLQRASIVMPRPDVTPLEILEAINLSDLVTSPASTLYSAWLIGMTTYPTVRLLKTDGSDTRAMGNFMKILTNGSQSEVRLRALSVRYGSRCEQLFGVGVVVTNYDIAVALRATP